MPLSIGFPDEKQHMGACHKSRRDERPQTGAQAPGSRATIKEAPTGRQRPKQAVIEPVRDSVAPSGLPIVLRHYVGGLHPRLWSFAPSVLIPRTATSRTPAKGGGSRSSKRGPMLQQARADAPASEGRCSSKRERGQHGASFLAAWKSPGDNQPMRPMRLMGPMGLIRLMRPMRLIGPMRLMRPMRPINICFSAISLCMTRKVTIFAANLIKTKE